MTEIMLQYQVQSNVLYWVGNTLHKTYRQVNYNLSYL